MKAIIFILFFIPAICFSQDGLVYDFNRDELAWDCGTWELLPAKISEWEITDTINYCADCDTTFIESEWEVYMNNGTLAVYCPCGCHYPFIKYQYSINEQGITRKRTSIQNWKHTPRPKSQYEIMLDKINQR